MSRSLLPPEWFRHRVDCKCVHCQQIARAMARGDTVMGRPRLPARSELVTPAPAPVPAPAPATVRVRYRPPEPGGLGSCWKCSGYERVWCLKCPVGRGHWVECVCVGGTAGCPEMTEGEEVTERMPEPLEAIGAEPAAAAAAGGDTDDDV